jgi:hypothetical protein
MIAEEIKWVELERKVFSTENENNETMKFLRLNINNDYNFKMHDVDSSDQLPNQYRFDHWMRKRKWWWAIFFWGIGVLMVNAYVCYVRYNMLHGKNRKDLLSHYEFRKQIILAWLEPETYWMDRDNASKSSKRKRAVESISSKDTRQTRSSNDKSAGSQRATPFTDLTLNPATGALSCRLDHSGDGHWPTPKLLPRAKCALHYWSTCVEERRHVVLCTNCKVHLCTYCFRMFHTVEDLVGQKDRISDELLQKKYPVDGSI